MKRTAFFVLALLLLPSLAQAFVPNDTRLSQQTYLLPVQAQAAWDRGRGSPNIIVAVIDSGVDISHPDLKDSIWTNTGEIPDDGIDNDLDGFIDDVHGWDFVRQTGDPQPDLSEGWLPGGAAHGTIVSGIIGAMGNNGEGIAGIAWPIRLMPLRAVDAFGRGNSVHVTQAIRYAVDHGAKVINLSFSGDHFDQAMHDEILRAYQRGVVVVAATGNTRGGMDLNKTPVYPVCFKDGDMDPVIGVAATDVNNRRASFSNYGSACADLAAPGTDMYSTSLFRPAFADFNEPYTGGWSGTSFAAPLVVGAAALLFSLNPSFTPSDIKNMLQSSADPVVGDPDASIGAGRLNIARALNVALALMPPVLASGAPSISPSVLNRDAANASLPSAAPVDSLVKLSGQPAVYYVGLDGKRHPFPNAMTYQTWFNDFSAVRALSPEDMAAIPLGMPILVRPGTYWVKIQSDPKTYFVEPHGYTLRWIKDEATAVLLGGADWHTRIVDVEPTYFTKFHVGADIDMTVLASSWPSGALMRAPGDDASAWYIADGSRRRIAHLADNFFQPVFVRLLPGAWQHFPEGLPLDHREDGVFSEQFLSFSIMFTMWTSQ